MLIQSLSGPCVEDNYGEDSFPDEEDDGLTDAQRQGGWAGDICGACGQEFSTRKAYREHMKQHQQAQPFSS